MAVITETTHAGEYLLDEQSIDYSRDTVNFPMGTVVSAGHVLGKLTGTENYVEYDNALADGSEVAVAIAFDAVDATAADTPGVISARDTVASLDNLVFKTGTDQAGIDAAVADLKAAGIIAR